MPRSFLWSLLVDAATARVTSALAAFTTFGGLAYAGVPVRCTANVLHPVSVHVTALDPIEPGQDVRLRVSVLSFVGLEHAVVRLVSTGEASVRGPAFVDIGSIPAGLGASRDFVISVPGRGSRHDIQFQVTGDGPLGRLTRAARYDLLPAGPLEP